MGRNIKISTAEWLRNATKPGLKYRTHRLVERMAESTRLHPEECRHRISAVLSASRAKSLYFMNTDRGLWMRVR